MVNVLDENIVFCPKCDSRNLSGDKSLGFACDDCGFEFDYKKCCNIKCNKNISEKCKNICISFMNNKPIVCKYLYVGLGY